MANMNYRQNPKYVEAIRARGPVLVYELEMPIRGAEGESTTTVSFREPTAGDVYEHGNPVTRVDYMVTPWRIERDQAAYFDMMAALSGVPVPNLMQMSPNDVLTCEAQLDRFFIPGVKTRTSPGTKDTSSKPPEPPAS